MPETPAETELETSVTLWGRTTIGVHTETVGGEWRNRITEITARNGEHSARIVCDLSHFHADPLPYLKTQRAECEKYRSVIGTVLSIAQDRVSKSIERKKPLEFIHEFHGKAILAFSTKIARTLLTPVFLITRASTPKQKLVSEIRMLREARDACAFLRDVSSDVHAFFGELSRWSQGALDSQDAEELLGHCTHLSDDIRSNHLNLWRAAMNYLKATRRFANLLFFDRRLRRDAARDSRSREKQPERP